MKRWSAVAAATLGLALMSGCGTGGSPVVGGVAAEVEDSTITLDDVDTLTDAFCVSQMAADDWRRTVPRSFAQTVLAETLVQTAVVDEVGLAQGAEPDIRLQELPGWSGMTADQRDAVAAYVAGEARLGAALQALVPADATDREQAEAAAFDALAQKAEDQGIEITINPRYGLEVRDGHIEGGTDLSVPVSDFAENASAEKLDIEYVRSLPDSQLCGPRPPAQDAPQG